MRRRFARTAVFIAMTVFTAMLVVVTAQETRRPQAESFSRTPDGRPDLNGIWQVLGTAAWDLEAHNAAEGVPAGIGVVVGHEIPYLPAARQQKADNFKNRATRDPLNNCYLPGVPRITYLPYPFSIHQTPSHVGITYEYSHATRMIFLNGTSHPESLQFWMGDSRGRWEGDTLVVDVANFNDQTWFDAAGNFHSDALHVVERYTPRGKDHILYEATIEDPKVFTRPWVIRTPLYRRLDEGAQVMDYECLEFKSPFITWDDVPAGLPKPPGR